MKRQLFSEINAYISGDMDKGLFIVAGKLIQGVDMNEAEKAIIEELEKIKNNIDDTELAKVKNKIESTHIFSEMSVLNKAMNLAFSELMGDAALVNQEVAKYMEVTKELILQQANEIFKETNCSTLYYRSEK
jgi:predicted Zn-dependent peptidase